MTEQRLIDANALVPDMGFGVRDMYSQKCIDNAPTIEKKRGNIVWYEEEHGNPIDGTDYDWGWKCSECGYLYDDKYDDPTLPPESNFCPSCGADMREITR